MNRDELHLSHEMSVVLPVIDRVFGQYAPRGYTVEFTAGKEWLGHSTWSLHHSGNAVDIRTKTLPDKGVGVLSQNIAKALQHELNTRFGAHQYTVLHNDQGALKPHIHIQRNSGGRWSAPGDFELSSGAPTA